MMLTFHRATIALLGLALAIPAHAAPAETDTTIVHVARPVSTSPAAMQRAEHRIAVAALEACGASAFSAREVKATVARSACWRDGYAGGIAQLRDSARAEADAGPRSPLADRR